MLQSMRSGSNAGRLQHAGNADLWPQCAGQRADLLRPLPVALLPALPSAPRFCANPPPAAPYLRDVPSKGSSRPSPPLPPLNCVASPPAETTEPPPPPAPPDPAFAPGNEL